MGSTAADLKNAKTLAFFDKAIQQVPQAMQKAFRDVLLDLAAQGAQRAPIKFGFLRGSIEPLAITVDKLAGRTRLVGGVAARTPYAHKQHEHEEYNHPLGGEAKYLTRPLQEREERYRDSLAKAAMDALKKAAS